MSEMSDMKILRYTIKYQDINVAIVQFCKEDFFNFLKNSDVFMEISEDEDSFWDRFEEALMEISGVFFVMVEGYEITIIKDPELQNWGGIIEDAIWCSVLFLNPGGGAIEVSKKSGKDIGKMITQKFDTVEPEYPHRDKK